MVVISGAARGQGRSHALTLARGGAACILVDRCAPLESQYPMATPDDLRETVDLVQAAGGDAVPIECDVRDVETLREAIADAEQVVGPVTGLVANHGIWFVEDTDFDTHAWTTTLDVNLNGTHSLCSAVIPGMKDRKHGRIVVTSSSTVSRPIPKSLSYIASKAALEGMVRALAVELAAYDITVNAVAPGSVDTNMTDHQAAYNLMAGHDKGTRADRDNAARSMLLPRTSLLAPQVISDAVAFLLSQRAANITGAVIPVDAGRHVQP